MLWSFPGTNVIRNVLREWLKDVNHIPSLRGQCSVILIWRSMQNLSPDRKLCLTKVNANTVNVYLISWLKGNFSIDQMIWVSLIVHLQNCYSNWWFEFSCNYANRLSFRRENLQNCLWSVTQKCVGIFLWAVLHLFFRLQRTSNNLKKERWSKLWQEYYYIRQLNLASSTF